MKVAPNHVIGISYTLTEKDSADVIESVPVDRPFQFIYGIGNLLPAFEDNLANLSIGENFDFILASADAYGDVDEQAIVDVPADVFMVNGQFAEDLVKVGEFINLQDQNGNPLTGKVVSRGLESVKIDFNHPMAGKSLHFKGSVVAVRIATDEELDHGHVHGPGGHQH